HQIVFLTSVFIMVTILMSINNNYLMNDDNLRGKGRINEDLDDLVVEPSFIGPKGRFLNETLGLLDTSKPIHVHVNESVAFNSLVNLSLGDLKTFFNERYGTQVLLENASGTYFNNSIIIGNETVNSITNALVVNGSLNITGRQPEAHGFDMQELVVGQYNLVIIRSIDDNGLANGIFWLIDRCKTQDPASLKFNYLRSPSFQYRITSVDASIPVDGNIHVANDTIYLNSARSELQDAARRGASHVILFGSIIGQYPALLNYSWLPNSLYQPDYSEIDRRREFAQASIEIAHGLGLKVLFWADQGNYVADSIGDWMLEKGSLSIYNERVKYFIQESLKELFKSFPNVDGIALRVGDDLYSGHEYYLMNTPDTFRESTKAFMEIVDANDKIMMLRTWQMSVRDWCVHANKDAYLEAFGGMNYSNLIISYKYSPNDYQRMPINPTANIGDIKQVVELQTTNSFENYQYTPLCMAEHYEKVLKNLTSSVNSKGKNLLVGVFNSFSKEVDLVTPELEGPGSMNGFRFEPNYYYLQRASWEPDVSAIDVCKDLAGKIMGREFRDSFYEWFYLSSSAHYHLFYLPFHRDQAPWLKSRWYHYTRYIKADPQAFGYLYYYCKKDVETVIDSVKEGLEIAIYMKTIVENISSSVTLKNKIYHDYFYNNAIHFVDFANLSHAYLKTALYYWKYVETLDNEYRVKAYDSLSTLKQALEHYNNTYHYYTDPEQGHKPGLIEVYAFVHWMEAQGQIEFTSWIIFAILILIISMSLFQVFKAKKDSSGLLMGNNVLISTWAILFKRYKFSKFYANLNEKQAMVKVIVTGILFFLLIALVNSFLLNSASFFYKSSTVFLYAFSTTMFMIGSIFSWMLVSESIIPLNKNVKEDFVWHVKDGRNSPALKLLSKTIYKTSLIITPFIIVQVFSSLMLALKGPIGFFDSQVVIPVLVNERFLDFTPISLEGFMIIIMLFASVVIMGILIGNLSVEPRPRKKPLKVFYSIIWSILIIGLLLGFTLIWFPHLFDNIDYYLNNALGIWKNIEFYP
ncbi:MAG: DUF2304 domain-containing protein, partial [Promethearchaeota archaeon]